MQRLVIYVDFTDESDIDWIRTRAVGAVEDVIEENADRLDGEATASWDMEDA